VISGDGRPIASRRLDNATFLLHVLVRPLPEIPVSSLGPLFALQLAVAAASAPAAAPSDPALRAVRYDVTVAAPVTDVWRALSTADGLRSFFAAGAEIELRAFGKFSIQFDPSKPGSSAEDNVVLAVQPERMLSTTWNAPPAYPDARAQRTLLQFRLVPEGAARTRVTIVQSGFGTGPEWDATYEYFRGAWTWVAASLQYRFEHGPIDWRAPPNLIPRMVEIGGEAAAEWARRM
jgi:uncharacterized protein YndB with AHSA1/START domain